MRSGSWEFIINNLNDELLSNALEFLLNMEVYTARYEKDNNRLIGVFKAKKTISDNKIKKYIPNIELKKSIFSSFAHIYGSFYRGNGKLYVKII
jgi:hypothetical protein